MGILGKGKESERGGNERLIIVSGGEEDIDFVSK